MLRWWLLRVRLTPATLPALKPRLLLLLLLLAVVVLLRRRRRDLGDGAPGILGVG